MTIQNIQTEHYGNNPGLFPRILKTAARFWEAYDSDREAKVAQGLLDVGDIVRPVDLSYNEKKHQLNLELRMKPSNSQNVVKERLVLSQDHWANLLASVTFEKEDHIVRIRAKTILDPAHNPDSAVKAIFEDLKSILIDPLFQQIVQ